MIPLKTKSWNVEEWLKKNRDEECFSLDREQAFVFHVYIQRKVILRF